MDLVIFLPLRQLLQRASVGRDLHRNSNRAILFQLADFIIHFFDANRYRVARH